LTSIGRAAEVERVGEDCGEEATYNLEVTRHKVGFRQQKAGTFEIEKKCWAVGFAVRV